MFQIEHEIHWLLKAVSVVCCHWVRRSQFTMQFIIGMLWAALCEYRVHSKPMQSFFYSCSTVFLSNHCGERIELRIKGSFRSLDIMSSYLLGSKASRFPHDVVHRNSHGQSTNMSQNRAIRTLTYSLVYRFWVWYLQAFLSLPDGSTRKCLFRQTTTKSINHVFIFYNVLYNCGDREISVWSEPLKY